MDRRHFLSQLSGLPLTLGLGAGLGAGLSSRLSRAEPSQWQTSFEAALAENPWLLGYHSVAQSRYEERELHIEGNLPPDLKGQFFRNGPAQHEVGNMRFGHWFDGYGMVHAYRFTGEAITHRARMVETQRYQQERQANRQLYDSFGTHLADGIGFTAPDDINSSNINIIQQGEELLALWDGGSAHRIDPESLDTLGLKTWSEDMAGLPFSAHPRLDSDGTLWGFGCASTLNVLVLYQISPSGSLVNRGVISTPAGNMVHDFMITERDIVFYLAPFVFEKTEPPRSYLEHHRWRPEEGGRILLIDKNDFSNVRQIETPPFWIFHFSNAYEEASGQIRFQAPLYETPEFMTETLPGLMRGEVKDSPPPIYSELVIDPARGRVDVEPLLTEVSSEFPRINEQFTAKRNRYSYLLSGDRDGVHRGFNQLQRIDAQSDRVTSYRFDDSEMAEEHVFIPRPGARNEAEGWLLGTTLDLAAEKTLLNLFDAEAIDAGPIARARLDYRIPLGFHGNFYPET